MRIKLDENLPGSIAVQLRSLGHDVHTVADEGLCGQADPVIRQAAFDEGRLLITQDLDFSDIRDLSTTGHPGILILRLRNPGQTELEAKTLQLFNAFPCETWIGHLVIATDTKVRIR